MSRYDEMIAAAAAKHGVPSWIIAAGIAHESAGDPLAIGDGGAALGLMQVHRGAALTVRADWDALKALIDASDSDGAAAMGIEIGTAYLAFCYRNLGDWAWALAAYNQGPTVIGRAKRYADAVLGKAGV